MTELKEASDHLKTAYDTEQFGGTAGVKEAERRYYLALEAAVLATPCPVCDVQEGPCTGKPQTAALMWSVSHDLVCHKPRLVATRQAHGDTHQLTPLR